MFRPLLAPREDPLSYPEYWDKIPYPCLVSPKYDGVRGIVKDGIVFSRTGKPLPNYQVQEQFGRLEHFDGELVLGNPTHPDVGRYSQSHVMSRDKVGDIIFYVFDYTDNISLPYSERLKNLYLTLKPSEILTPVLTVPQIEVNSQEMLLKMETNFLKMGFEGVMIRDPSAPYKNGRGTINEGIIIKLKRFKDSEGIIVDILEQFTNTNFLEEDELGYAKRSTMKDGMVKANTTGKFVLSWNGQNIHVAPGNFNHEERQEIWENRELYLGRYLKFRYFEYGIKDKPRFPRAIGFRDEMDI